MCYTPYKLTKNPCRAATGVLNRFTLDGAGDLTGAQATGAGIYPFWGTVHHSLDAFDIRTPGTIGSTMRVRNSNAEGYAFTAEITFSHVLHLLLNNDYRMSKRRRAFRQTDFIGFCELKCTFILIRSIFIAMGIVKFSLKICSQIDDLVSK